MTIGIWCACSIFTLACLMRADEGFDFWAVVVFAILLGPLFVGAVILALICWAGAAFIRRGREGK